MPSELIASKIYIIRRLKVMLDRDLAQLYGVETKQLKRAVKRNLDRFPADFMFELNTDEYDALRCQTGTLKRGAHSKYPPFAFTEQGVAMLSSVLNSKRAIQVNIQIMRVFTRFRQILLSNKDLRRELEELQRVTDDWFRVVFETLDQLLSHEERPRRKIGFKVEEKAARYRVTRKRSVN
ncbi:MAG: ORF6N domain-containing protein [Proteobacteria bacterium]|nr:ORF6N domain-containing protein [Pseudomonadota bacterium]